MDSSRRELSNTQHRQETRPANKGHGKDDQARRKGAGLNDDSNTKDTKGRDAGRNGSDSNRR